MGRILFVNLTRLCNVECPRCYLTEASRRTRTRLPAGMLAKILSSEFFSGAGSAAAGAEPPLVLFQGGEPTVVGREAFEAYVAEVRGACPSARMSMITNLLSLPDWTIDLVHEAFSGHIETTWAAGMKMTLNGSEAAYQRRFRRNLARAVASGISCPVNTELNPETVAAGPDAVLDMMVETGARDIAFDISGGFDALRRAPAFGPGHYPTVPLTVSYATHREFLLALRRRIHLRGLSDQICVNVLRPLSERRRDLAFNTARESDFVTVNPDGTVTTNPLFSDVPSSHLGSLYDTDLDTLLEHPDRAVRSAFEELRRAPCRNCRFFDACAGGPSHFPLFDGSGECAGMKGVLERLVV